MGLYEADGACVPPQSGDEQQLLFHDTGKYS